VTPALLDQVLDRIFGVEGGLSNHPSDRGGLTKYGLTRPFLEDTTGRKWSDDDIRDLTSARARSITKLWAQMRRLDQLPEDFLLAWIVIDFAFHAGHRRAIRAVQQAIGVHVDGIAGSETQGAWHLLSPASRKRVVGDVLYARLDHHGRDVKANREQGDFVHGWLLRVGEQVRAACTA
jgi:lysozyme family protein